MSKKPKIAIIMVSAFFLVALLLFLGYYSMNETDRDISSITPEKQLMAEDLIAYFKLHKKESDTIFAEKVVGIKGIVKEVNHLNNRHTILLHGGKNETASIICDMQTDQIGNVDKLKPGDTVFLKGIFKGFLKDIILLHCVITDTDNKKHD